MTALGADGSWSLAAADEFRFDHGLSLIESAARACAVFERRWTSRSGERAIAVLIREQQWLVYPVGQGWVAVGRDDRGELDRTRSVELRRGAGERQIPTTAWGRLLADDVALAESGPAPTPHVRARSALQAWAGR